MTKNNKGNRNPPIPNTVLRNGVYHFRKRIPESIAGDLPPPFTNKKFIYISLKIGNEDYARAVAEAHDANERFKKEFAILKAKRGHPTSAKHLSTRLDTIFNGSPINRDRHNNVGEFNSSNQSIKSGDGGTIREWFDIYLGKRIIKETTKSDWNKGWEYFLDIVNLNWDSDITNVTHSTIDTFIKEGMNLPAHTNQKIFKNKTPSQMIAICKKANSQPKRDTGNTSNGHNSETVTYKTISNATMNKHLGGISAVCKLAVDRTALSKDPTKGAFLDIDQNDRVVYDAVDIKNIFNHKVFRDIPKGKWGEHQWIPLIAFYTGARLEEIGQLLTSDIKTSESGVIYFAINQYDKYGKISKSVKDKGHRNIPIHKRLIEIGLIDYLERIKSSEKHKTDEHLFPELNGWKDKRTHNFSKWWGRQRKAFKVIDARKVFHSIKHTFTDRARNDGIVDEQIRDYFTAHGDKKSESRKTYGTGHGLKILKENIDKIHYDIDL
jgi:integrase